MMRTCVCCVVFCYECVGENTIECENNGKDTKIETETERERMIKTKMNK